MADNLNNNTNSTETENYQTPEEAYTKRQAPAVAAKPGKNFVFIGVFVLIVGAIVYALMGDPEPEIVPQKTDEVYISQVKPIDSSGLTVPPLPPAPPPAPVKPEIEEDPDASTEIEITPEEKAQAKARMQSEMLINSGSGGLLGGGGGGGVAVKPSGGVAEVNDNDPNIGFADTFYNQKDTPFATARKLGDTSRLITQGKIIDAVLETPINTDIPGMIRAVVSRDIYAEAGRAILIPKGSRLVGTYNSFIIRGNKRVNVIWSRVIRPDGIDIMLRSPGTDQLGTAGVGGEVDNKYLEIFASAFLVSAINIAVGYGTDQLDPSTQTETTNTDGSRTRTTTATQEAGREAVDLFGAAGNKLVEGFLNLKPTITIDQGTRINVFVNRDLVFPSGLAANSLKIIQ